MGRYLDLAKQAPLHVEEAPPREEETPLPGDAPFPKRRATQGSLLAPEVTTKTTETTKAPPPRLLEPDDPEVAWRLEAMRKQVPPSGAIPDLISREAPIQPGTCFSCGDLLRGSQRYRCRPCAVAAAIAIWGSCPENIAALLAQDESS